MPGLLINIMVFLRLVGCRLKFLGQSTNVQNLSLRVQVLTPQDLNMECTRKCLEVEILIEDYWIILNLLGLA